VGARQPRQQTFIGFDEFTTGFAPALERRCPNFLRNWGPQLSDPALAITGRRGRRGTRGFSGFKVVTRCGWRGRQGSLGATGGTAFSGVTGLELQALGFITGWIASTGSSALSALSALVRDFTGSFDCG